MVLPKGKMAAGGRIGRAGTMAGSEGFGQAEGAHFLIVSDTQKKISETLVPPSRIARGSNGPITGYLPYI